MGSGADASGCAGVSTGNAASGVGGISVISDAVGVGGGDAVSGAVGGNAASLPKTNSSSTLSRGLRFLALMLKPP